MHDLPDESIAAEYDRLRDELRALLAAPAPDLAAVEHTMQALDDAHMRFKQSHGLQGNNPLE